MHPPSVAPQPRYRRAVNHHHQPRSSSSSSSGLLAAARISMASSCDSEPCVMQQRPPVADLTPCEEQAPEAGTSESADHQAAAGEARPAGEPAVDQADKKKKKQDKTAEEDAAAAGSPSFVGAEPARRPPVAAEESARERLKRHRTEMAGRVRIPDMWGQERLLKDWVDCAVFDRPLAATAGLLNARDALVAECAAARRATGRPLRVQNGCS